MNSIFLLIVLFLEVMMVLQCLQIAFKKEVRLDKYTVGIVLIDVSLYMLINMKMIPAMCAILLYIFFFLYCYFEFGQVITKTIIGLIIGLVLAGCIESILAFLGNFIKTEKNSEYVLVILSLMALVFAYFVKRIVILLNLGKMIKYNRDMHGMTVLLGVSMVVLLIDYYLIQKLVNIYIVAILAVLLLLLFFLYRLEMARNEIEKKNYELELQRVYGNAYEELITAVRRRQHDYKNQLSAIYSTHLVANSLEELICLQNKYGNTIRYDSKFDSILTNCNNPILAGYLYHKCVACEQGDIQVCYNIHVDQAECCFQLHEIIEILGVLIDNACENFIQNPVEHKQINIECRESEEEIVICVSNPSHYIAYSDIEIMFVEGFSTKGENRGIGLARVLDLTKKHAAEMKVTNIMYNEDNWIEFQIRIAK